MTIENFFFSFRHPNVTISYWLDQPYVPRPSLSQNLIAEAAVIGGGMTGVALALSLLARGIHVVLIEANTMAGGRNRTKRRVRHQCVGGKELAVEGKDEIHRLCRNDRPMRPSPALAEL